jgi:hypothetical protein
MIENQNFVITWHFVKREHNTVADGLAKDELNRQRAARPDSLSRLQKRQNSTTTYVRCPICDTSSESLARLGQHIRRDHHSQGIQDDWLRRYKMGRCEQCGHIYRSLQQHIRACTGPTPRDAPACHHSGIFHISTDTDFLEALARAARQDETAWNSLFGATSLTRTTEARNYKDAEEEEIPCASYEDQFLNALRHLTKGSTRKATSEINSLGVAPDTAFVRKQLQMMNPPPFQPFQESDYQQCEKWDLPPSIVKNQMKQMKADSCPGPSGISVQSVKKAMATEEGANSITQVVNRILNGVEPHTYCLTAAKLVPLVKSSTKIRPIAAGEVLTRLAARTLLKHQEKELLRYLKPLQMGVKEKGGIETIIHSVRGEFNSGNAILSLDLANAFNSISREKIRRTLAENFPDMLPYFVWAYQHSAPLYFGEEVLAYSTEGVRQGDPLGPAFFALGIQDVLKQVQEEFPSVTVLAYLDDVTVTGPPSTLVHVARRFRNLVAECGLQMNMNKSVLCVPPEMTTPNAAGLPIVKDGIEILGAPVGTSNFESSTCLRKVRDMRKTLLVKPETAISAQSRYILLKDSVIPTLNHLLRSVPPWNREKAVEYFDNVVMQTAQLLLGAAEFGDMKDVENCELLRLPLRLGGLGLTRASMVSLPAYVASTWEAGVLHDAETRLLLISSLQNYQVDIKEEDLKQQAPNRKQQQFLTDQVMKNRLYALMRAQDEEMNARLKASQQPGAQDWLSVLPTSNTKQFSDQQWRIAVRLRLGLTVSRSTLPAECPLCDGMVDALHPFVCAYSDLKAERTERHNQLRDSLLGMLSAWAFQTKKEPLVKQEGQVNSSGRANEKETRLRGDVELIQTSGPMIVDLSVIHPSAVRNQQNLRPTAATSIREQSKCRKYEQPCQQVHKAFLPFVLQTFGGIGNKGLEFLSNLKNRPACFRVYQPSTYVNAIRHGLVSRLMKTNSNMVIRWLQLISPLKEGGVASSSSRSA